MSIYKPVCCLCFSAGGGIAINEANFPDKNFRSYVNTFDTDGNGTLSDDECSSVTRIWVSSLSISTLKGIEHFKNLDTLNCPDNNLTKLDVSKNTALTNLNCGKNQLTELDVKANTKLSSLSCGSNQLTSLDVSENKDLTKLDCSKNPLQKLDVKLNTALTDLNCSENGLKELDVKSNTKLTDLNCGNNQLTSLDVSKNKDLTKLDCRKNQLPKLDAKVNNALTNLNCSENQLKELNVTKNTALTNLDCSKNKLQALDVKANNALINLNCAENQLKELDVKANTKLTDLHCNNNQLTSLDVSKNTALDKLYCFGNQLRNLDVINNIKLTELECGSNYLKELNVTKNTALTRLSCDFLRLNLDVSKNTNLTFLSCEDGELTKLDVNNNTKLTFLRCNGCCLTKLDVSKNTALITLWCEDNELTSLDLSKNTVLANLYCSGNKLTNLNLSQNSKLELAYGHENPLISVQLNSDNQYEDKNFNPRYYVKIAKGSKKVPFSKLPQGFDSNNIVCDSDEDPNYECPDYDDDGFTWDGETTTIKFKYQLSDDPELIGDATIYITKVDGILDVDDPSKTTPDGYVRLTFDAKDGKIDGKDKVAIDVLKGTSYNDPELKARIEKIKAVPTDNGMTFDKWSGLPTDTSSVDESKTFEAAYKQKVFDKNKIEKMVVKTQPTKLTYTEGEKLDLTGLVVTLTDNQGITKDVAFSSVAANGKASTSASSNKPEPAKLSHTAEENPILAGLFVNLGVIPQGKQNSLQGVSNSDFASYAITAVPANGTVLKATDNNKKVKLTIGNLAAETNALTVNKKVFDPNHVESMTVKTQPTKLTYTEGEKLDLTGLAVTLTDNQGVTKDVAFADFKANNITTEPANEAELKLADNGTKVKLTTGNLTAETNALTVNKKVDPAPNPTDPVVGPVDPQDPNGTKPADLSKYYKVTFESEDTAKGTVDAKNTVYVLKSANKTLQDLKDSTPKLTAKDGYTFDKWSPALDATVIANDVTIKACFKKADAPAPNPTPALVPDDNTPATDSNNPQGASAKSVPQTGDSANGLLYAAFMGLPGVLLLAAGLRKRRKQH